MNAVEIRRIVSVLAIVGIANGAVAASYHIMRIGSLGGTETRAMDINDAGHVVGTSYLDGDLVTRGFVFDIHQDSSPRRLDGIDADSETEANAINNAGDIVGQNLKAAPFETTAILWGATGMTDIGADLRAIGGNALDINDAGVVVGMAALDSQFSDGFIWEGAGRGLFVGTLEGRNGGANRSVNNDGIVVGNSFFLYSPDQAHMVTRTEEGYVSTLISAPYPGIGVAGSINNKGVIVGFANLKFGPHTAVIFTPGEEDIYIDLGPLPHAESSEASDVNDDGVIVGSSGDHPEWTETHAFVFENGQMHDLNDLVVDLAEEWAVLIHANAVNNAGVIVGYGRTLDGNISAFVLIPDEVEPPAHFVRGDSNASNAIDIADAIFTLGYLFAEGTPPTCLDAADANDSGDVDIADVITFLTYLFANQGPLPQPSEVCGPDSNTDELDCSSFSPCEGP
jgi:probable HAF family extracellular repeat protein